MSSSMLNDGLKDDFEIPDFRKQFCISVGSSIVPGNVRQQKSDARELLKDAEVLYPVLEELSRDLARRIKTHSEMGPIKTLPRMRVKAKAEKHDNMSSVLDVNRCTVWVETGEQIESLRKFFCPSTNKNTKSIVDNFAKPAAESDLRRMKVNYEIDNGHGISQIVEIQIKHVDMERAYAATHDLYIKARAIENRFPDPATRDISIQKKLDHLNRIRTSLHSYYAKEYGLDELVETNKFYMLDKKPVVLIDKGRFGQTAAVPDTELGVYVEDINVLKDVFDGKASMITCQEFLEESVLSVLHHRYNAELEARKLAV